MNLILNFNFFDKYNMFNYKLIFSNNNKFELIRI